MSLPWIVKAGPWLSSKSAVSSYSPGPGTSSLPSLTANRAGIVKAGPLERSCVEYCPGPAAAAELLVCSGKHGTQSRLHSPPLAQYTATKYLGCQAAWAGPPKPPAWCRQALGASCPERSHSLRGQAGRAPCPEGGEIPCLDRLSLSIPPHMTCDISHGWMSSGWTTCLWSRAHGEGVPGVGPRCRVCAWPRGVRRLACRRGQALEQT